MYIYCSYLQDCKILNKAEIPRLDHSVAIPDNTESVSESLSVIDGLAFITSCSGKYLLRKESCFLLAWLQ